MAGKMKMDAKRHSEEIAPGSPSCWRRYRLVLKMRATPASVSTQVSAHCFSAVSREWWMRMLPPPDSIFSLSAVVDDALTQSSSWYST
ncbi:hypothetical protein EYF80_022330 [Liparis tanakae]|uniref:Uncharacterized protein n=1 Tax=Liparis tanakae TaxID=230148 RepID=A0A4Z2HQ49_9TELE|nr:hypothetical protein EYF80_022330 [Liparis tanakae]